MLFFLVKKYYQLQKAYKLPKSKVALYLQLYGINLPQNLFIYTSIVFIISVSLVVTGVAYEQKGYFISDVPYANLGSILLGLLLVFFGTTLYDKQYIPHNFILQLDRFPMSPYEKFYYKLGLEFLNHRVSILISFLVWMFIDHIIYFPEHNYYLFVIYGLLILIFYMILCIVSVLIQEVFLSNKVGNGSLTQFVTTVLIIVYLYISQVFDKGVLSYDKLHNILIVSILICVLLLFIGLLYNRNKRVW
jgi:hypothetical protein